MGKADFTFRNETREKITVKHVFKNVTREKFSLEHLQSQTIKVNIIASQTCEKYLLYDSADATTGKYVSSDEYTNSKEVTIVKQGDEFQLNFHPRYKLTFPTTWTKLYIKLPMHSCYGRSIRICPRGLDCTIVLTCR